MKRVASIVFILVLFIGLFSPMNVLAKEDNDYKEKIDEYVTLYEAGLASCEVVVFDETGTLYSGYYGYADIDNKIKADESTVYEWGSCSKLLTWVSIMQLWEEEKVDFDTDIREYLPEGFLTKLQYKDEKITLLNLMNHDAGFQESYYENQTATEEELFSSLEEAVKKTECFQAYHVGKHTAYSNWGTALAAYIVERVSGEDYVDYVHKHIFTPLGMQHTSMDNHMGDNKYVKDMRMKLNCYYRGAESKDNEDYGTCISWVQLFPAGSAVGTLEDFTKFAMAFVDDDCLLFQNKETREEMFSPTSFYSDSNIAKNCHGLWTSEYGVQTLGHAGNTGGCSSNLVFDPVSKLGVVVMTNEPGETIFNYGIPKLIFDGIIDREEYSNVHYEDYPDISGTYIPSRCINSGAAMFQKYTGGLFPWFRNEDGTYSMKMLGMELEASLYPIGKNQYLMDNNGMEVFLYQSMDEEGNTQLEMMSTDYILLKNTAFCTTIIYSVIVLGLLCIITLLIKIIVYIVRKISKKERASSFVKKQIELVQFMYGITAIILLMMMGVIPGLLSVSHGFTVLSAILAALLGLLAVVNACVLFYNIIKEKGKRVIRTSIRMLWALSSFLYTAFIVAFQFYNFWNL